MTLDRLGDWDKFSAQMKKHIDIYTIPQYQSNDDKSDQVGAWTYEDCMKAIMKYVSRMGKGSRGIFESQRDILKIAHYAQFAYNKFKETYKTEDIY